MRCASRSKESALQCLFGILRPEPELCLSFCDFGAFGVPWQAAMVLLDRGCAADVQVSTQFDMSCGRSGIQFTGHSWPDGLASGSLQQGVLDFNIFIFQSECCRSEGASTLQLAYGQKPRAGIEARMARVIRSQLSVSQPREFSAYQCVPSFLPDLARNDLQGRSPLAYAASTLEGLLHWQVEDRFSLRRSFGALSTPYWTWSITDLAKQAARMRTCTRPHPEGFTLADLHLSPTL